MCVWGQNIRQFAVAAEHVAVHVPLPCVDALREHQRGCESEGSFLLGHGRVVFVQSVCSICSFLGPYSAKYVLSGDGVLWVLSLLAVSLCTQQLDVIPGWLTSPLYARRSWYVNVKGNLLETAVKLFTLYSPKVFELSFTR